MKRLRKKYGVPAVTPEKIREFSDYHSVSLMDAKRYFEIKSLKTIVEGLRQRPNRMATRGEIADILELLIPESER